MMIYKNRIAFILDHKLQHYRVPFFNKLVQETNFEIDVFHKEKPLQIDEKGNLFLFNEKFFNVKKIGPFVLREFEANLRDYDIVVYMQNLRYLDLWMNTLNIFRSYRLIHWGIGVSSGNGLDKQSKSIIWLRNFLTNYVDGVVYYSSYPLKYISSKNQKKSYVAYNTILNEYAEDFSHNPKKSFLFIGTLNKRKGVDVLLNAFSIFLKHNRNKNIDLLRIVGDGVEMNNLKKLVADLNITDKVEFLGNITDFEKKKLIYSEALISISPKQAGLSVLESFSFGVPFMAFENAISGGEHLNIENELNGYLVKNENELYERMLQLSSNVEKHQYLGKNAYLKYTTERSMDDMVNGFVNAFDNVLK